MYTVEFYENDRGVSELWDFLEELRIKSASNKDARIQYKQIVLSSCCRTTEHGFPRM